MGCPCRNRKRDTSKDSVKPQPKKEEQKVQEPEKK